MDMGKKIMLSVFLIGVVSNLVAGDASSGVSGLSSALCVLYSALTQIIPVVCLILVVLAGVVYAAGEMTGAETRARAHTWATGMIVGAVVGLVIILIAPSILGALYPGVENACKST
jgi:hypothetical protein